MTTGIKFVAITQNMNSNLRNRKCNNMQLVSIVQQRIFGVLRIHQCVSSLKDYTTGTTGDPLNQINLLQLDTMEKIQSGNINYTQLICYI